VNRIERALWRIFVLVVLAIGLPIGLLVALVELVVCIAVAIAKEATLWFLEVRDKVAEVLDSAVKSFRKGGKLDGTEHW
jgi:predicted ATP-grasp superfamily ATP-dependent carboligase